MSAASWPQPFLDFDRLNFGVFLVALVVIVGLPSVIVPLSGATAALAVLAVLTSAVVGVAALFRASRVAVALHRTPGAPVEIVAGGRRVAVADPAAVRFGLVRRFSRRGSKHYRDYLRVVVPAPAGARPLVLDELILREYPDLPFLDDPLPRGTHTFRSLSVHPGPVAALLRELGFAVPASR